MDQFEEQELILIFLIGSLGMLVMLGAVGFFIVSYQRKLLKMHRVKAQMEHEQAQKIINGQLEGQERERSRLAAELHDSLGSLLISAKLNSSYAQRIVGHNQNATQIFDEINNILEQSIETVRRISWELTPQAFKDAGLSHSVKRLCERLDGKGKTITFSNMGDIAWNDDDALHVYRIIQELLNNAIKHADADTISVAFLWKTDVLEVQVADNGIGFELQHVREGVGWTNIAQRLNHLGGEIKLEKPIAGTGSQITLVVPLKIQAKKTS